MNEGMNEAEGLAAFYTERAALLAEREVALDGRIEDRERWVAAKHAYAEWRTAMRELGAAYGTVSAPTAEATAAVNEEG